MKKTLIILLAVVMVFTLVACGGGSGQQAENTEGTDTTATTSEKPGDTASTGTVDKVVIGACVMDLANEIFIQYTNGYKAFTEACGGKVEINVVDGASKPEKQVEALENFINSGVGAIMLNALDLSAVEDVINRAMDNDIKVGVYPSREGVTMNFVFDEYIWGFDLGVEAGNWINEHLDGKAKVACFNQAELEQALGRYNGYIDGVLSVCEKDNIEFLEPISTVEPVSAQSGMETIMKAHPDVKVVLCSADAAAVGAYQAIIGSNLDTTDMFLGGCDGIPEALQYIQEGTVFRATCANAKSTEEMGFDLVQNLTKAVLGLDHESEYVAPTKIVNSDNIEEYLAAKPNYQLDPELATALGQ
ncbi:sugar ABC transporter substrate-binding protein [Aminicella lysinilytica]|uniref:sugar ABC transporter substrate-binding protein n=1 Tax=Aminicella lysinilytica TaxID=433323 RepID=UPI0026EF818F|nr:sugar ABC transporter substrate-binding protein [Aminicella lysinilytica]